MSMEHNKESKRKGQGGTILVIGGSSKYIGAPTFVTKSAFRTGAEMIFVMVPGSKTCRNVLKHVHEAIVGKLCYDTKILEKVTACVIGPGLGKILEIHLEIILNIVEYLNNKGIYCVLDADILHYYKLGFFNKFTHLILTPNYHEKIGLTVHAEHFCIYKDEIDKIFQGNQHIKNVSVEKVCKKRCCGLGDMLAGIVAALISNSSCNKTQIPLVLAEACFCAKITAYNGFLEKGYGLIVSDVIELIPQYYINK